MLIGEEWAISLQSLCASELPLNRKERFYTGTVFPMIVCKDDFRDFGRFTRLLPDYEEQPLDFRPSSANVQFFTEYCLVDSIYGTSKDRFPSRPKLRDTPDIVILVCGERRVLIALEAKMFDVPSRPDLRDQLKGQRVILDYLLGVLKVDQFYHGVLLPQQLKDRVVDIGAPIITWQELAASFEEVRESDYFLSQLRSACDRYDELKAKPGPMANAEDRITGEAIEKGYLSGNYRYRIMGRSEGLSGRRLAEDIRSKRWGEQLYEVSSCDSSPNRNWFYIKDFVERVQKQPGN